MSSRALLAIDPGPRTSGVVYYDTRTKRVLWAENKAPTEEVIRRVKAARWVACERVQSYGIAGASLLQTSEVYGRVLQAATDADARFVGLYRREVLRHLDVAGKGSKDSQVRQRVLEILAGGDAKAARGTKAAPGPLYGVSGHAWQALALAVVVHEQSAALHRVTSF